MSNNVPIIENENESLQNEAGNYEPHDRIEEENPEDQQGLYEQNNEESAMEADEDFEADAQGLLALERDFQITHAHETAAQLIDIYKNANDIQNVRRIRESLLEFNILSEDEWNDWILDEIAEAHDDAEKKAILKLFDRAFEDIFYFELAEFACEYVEKLFKEGLVRKQGVVLTINKLINASCFDFNRGSTFFNKLRKFEEEQNTSPEEKERVIRTLYERQLKLHLADIDVAFGEYYQWEKNKEELKRIAPIYNETYKDIAAILDIEEALTSVIDPFDHDNFKPTMQALLSKEGLKLERKLNLLERCVEANPTEKEVWEVYTEFANRCVELPDQLEKIYKKAWKVCSSNVEIATKYLRILEKRHTELEDIKKKAKAMMINFTESKDYFDLMMLLCEIHVRALNTKLVDVKGDLTKAKEEMIRFRQAVQEAVEFFSSDKSEESQGFVSSLYLFKSHIETYTLKDKKEMNNSMDKFVKQNGSNYHAWYQYAIFEQALGRPSTVRSILKRGCEYTKDDIHSMYKFAIDYERKFGSLEDLESMEKKYNEKVAKMVQEGEMVIEQEPAPAQTFQETRKKLKEKKENQKDKPTKNLKRRKNDEPIPDKDDEEYALLKHDLKKPKVKIDFKGSKTEQERPVPVQVLRQPNKSSAIVEEEKQEPRHESKQETKQETQAQETQQEREPIAYPTYLDTRNTVFIKNFPNSFIEEDVKSIFANAEHITGCRIIKDKISNISKGMAYIDFINPEEAAKACESDGMSLDGKKLYIALSDPQKKGDEDSKTLFVNNLPFSVTEQMLEEVFSAEKAQIREIRIPRKPDGNARGFAYIVFSTEDAAIKAAEKHKHITVGERTANVERANSKKKHDQVLKALNVAFLGGLDFKVSEQDVRDFFHDFEVKRVKLVIDKKTGKSKGLCFVEFQTSHDLDRALSIPEPELLGRKFTITRSTRPITDDQHEEERPAKKNALSKKDAKKPKEETTEKKDNNKKEDKKKEEKKPEEKKGEMKTNDFFKSLFK